MNCQDFQSIVVDLVRGDVADSGFGTACWAHAASCSRCADLLLQHEKLSAGLEALATQTETLRAPERIEAVLRAEFRKHHGARPEPAAAPRLVNAPKRAAAPFWWAAGAVAAAVLLATLAGAVIVKMRTKSASTLVSEAQPAGKASSTTPASDTGNARSSLSNQKPVGTHAGREATRPSAPAKPADASPRLKRQPEPAVWANPSDEVATAFYPLPYGSGLTLDDGWQMVRVSMPRSELASLGMPALNEQAANETVKADLVLGEDGLPRAIRFVQ